MDRVKSSVKRTPAEKERDRREKERNKTCARDFRENACRQSVDHSFVMNTTFHREHVGVDDDAGQFGDRNS